MNSSANDKATPGDSDSLRTLRHDINNQLSNILLALGELRHEMPAASEDCIFYLDLISTSTAKISSLLKESGS